MEIPRVDEILDGGEFILLPFHYSNLHTSRRGQTVHSVHSTRSLPKITNSLWRMMIESTLGVCAKGLPHVY